MKRMRAFILLSVLVYILYGYIMAVKTTASLPGGMIGLEGVVAYFILVCS